MGGKKSNHIKQSLRKFGGVRSWQLLLILIPLSFVTATLLRLDHLRMSDLLRAVVEADAEDNATLTEERLLALKKFVGTHVIVSVVETNGIQSITFGTGPFYLENQYLRAANAAIASAEAKLIDDKNPNGNIFAAASAVCHPLALQNGWAWNSPGYLDCYTTELAKYPASDALSSNLLSADLPPTDLFRHNYLSPVWAPTWSGLAILACVVIILTIIIRFLIWCALKIALIFVKKPQ